jgi:phosphatidylserine/phosphatidylglycerophosphate/cardiolipin synthase-like enzyme
MDLRDACWDDRRHLAVNPDRLSRGSPHKPYHDVQVYLTGGATPRALEQYFFERWQRAGGTPPPLRPPLTGGDDLRPRDAVVLGAAQVGLSRTEPHADAPAIREVECLIVDAIASAERLVYIETQYFSSRRIRDALVRRMRDAGRPRLEIIVVVNERAEAIKEEMRWDSARRRTSKSSARSRPTPDMRSAVTFPFPPAASQTTPWPHTFIPSS